MLMAPDLYASGHGEEQVSVSGTELPAADVTGNSHSTSGLIADLALILLLGAIVTILFKKLRQPVVLGYILAGFLASPNFSWLPSIHNLANIDFWAEIGIVILMFTLGLEFSFKKLVGAGSSAIITAFIIITGMTFAGFGVGQLLDFNFTNSIFLGHAIHVEHDHHTQSLYRSRTQAKEVCLARIGSVDHRRPFCRADACDLVIACHG